MDNGQVTMGNKQLARTGSLRITHFSLSINETKDERSVATAARSGNCSRLQTDGIQYIVISIQKENLIQHDNLEPLEL